MIHATELEIRKQEKLLIIQPEDVSKWEEKIDKALLAERESGSTYHASVVMNGISSETFYFLVSFYESNGWKCIPDWKDGVRVLNFIPKDEFRKGVKYALVGLAVLLSVFGLAVAVIASIFYLGS
ncbi:MAG TPA: hypothetical protein PLP33_24820 [Leptospiraceae bacterium]|nr:hypothetical protein [Leptospiraceae bacterium]